MHDILFLLHASHCCSPPPSSFLSILPPSFLHRSLHFPCIPPTLLPHSYLLPIIHPSFTQPPSYTLLLSSVASLSFVRLIRNPIYLHISPWYLLSSIFFWFQISLNPFTHIHTPGATEPKRKQNIIPQMISCYINVMFIFIIVSHWFCDAQSST